MSNSNTTWNFSHGLETRAALIRFCEAQIQADELYMRTKPNRIAVGANLQTDTTDFNDEDAELANGLAQKLGARLLECAPDMSRTDFENAIDDIFAAVTGEAV